jgi:hypothetical protein
LVRTNETQEKNVHCESFKGFSSFGFFSPLWPAPSCHEIGRNFGLLSAQLLWPVVKKMTVEAKKFGLLSSTIKFVY